jgi:hypothetical protein
MDDPKKSTTITIAVTPELKKEIQAVAKSKRWSVSSTLGLFLEEYWEMWLDEQGVEPPSKKKAQKPN